MLALALLPLLALTTYALPAVDSNTERKPVQKRYSGVYIVSGRSGKCLATLPKTGNGSPVNTIDCNTYSGQGPHVWDINPGSGSVVLTGTDLVLDAGTTPGNNGLLKVWQSYPGLYQQTWYLTGDNRIAITGGDQCLDEGDNGPQTYRCTTGNTNQVWYIRPASEPPVTPTDPPHEGPGDPVAYPQTFRPTDNTNRCLTVQNGQIADGSPVQISTCSTELAQFQTWETNVNFSGLFRLSGTNFCLDAGINPFNGVALKIWTCYDGLFQQTWTFDGVQLRLTGGNDQCIQVQPDAPGGRPIVSLANVLVAPCNFGDVKQFFLIASA